MEGEQGTFVGGGRGTFVGGGRGTFVGGGLSSDSLPTPPQVEKVVLEFSKYCPSTALADTTSSAPLVRTEGEREGEEEEQVLAVSPKGLSLLVQRCLGRPLDKTQQLSDWERRPLRREQVLYAGESGGRDKHLHLAACLPVPSPTIASPPPIPPSAPSSQLWMHSVCWRCMSTSRRWPSILTPPSTPRPLQRPLNTLPQLSLRRTKWPP